MLVYGHVVIATGLTHVGREDVRVASVKDFSLEVRRQRAFARFLVILQSYVPAEGSVRAVHCGFPIPTGRPKTRQAVIQHPAG